MNDPASTGLTENWNAFRKLAAQGKFSLDYSYRSEKHCVEAGWFSWWHMFQRRKVIMRRMISDPIDFRNACLWGIDIVWAQTGNAVAPARMAEALREKDR